MFTHCLHIQHQPKCNTRVRPFSLGTRRRASSLARSLTMADDSHRPPVGVNLHDVASVSSFVAEDAPVRARSAVRYGAAAYSVDVDESDGSEYASVADDDTRAWADGTAEDSEEDVYSDLFEEAMAASISTRSERGRRGKRWSRAPSRGLRCAALSAVSLVVAVAFTVRGSVWDRASNDLGMYTAPATTWVSKRSHETPGARPGGFKLRNRSSKWRVSPFATSKANLGFSPLGLYRMLTNGRPASFWDPTKIKTKDGHLPAEFDVREKWSECADVVDTVLDQGECGSCWAVAPAKVMSDRLCIATNGTVKQQVSALQLLACETTLHGAFVQSSKNGCEGGFPSEAYEKAFDHGLTSGGMFGDTNSCMPYEFQPCEHPCEPLRQAHCPETCANGGDIKPTYHVTSIFNCPTNDYDCIALELWNNGPMSSYVGDVYDEFYDYESGVYSTSKDPERRGKSHGGHVMEIIGWGVDENGRTYWKMYNSWLNWGENGFGKIAVGELSIGEDAEAATLAPVSNE